MGSPRKGQVSILILSPTRELALQIAAEATRLVAKLRRPLEVHTAFGGTAKASTLDKFKKGDPKILVATPGRLEDYLTELDVRKRFEGMKTLILDEADRMLDAGEENSSSVAPNLSSRLIFVRFSPSDSESAPRSAPQARSKWLFVAGYVLLRDNSTKDARGVRPCA